MRSLIASIVVFFLILAGCGSDETTPSNNQNNANNQADMNRADMTVDECANVGCGAPPMCSIGCQEPCGCCGCGEGETANIQGMAVVCTAQGCWEPVADAGTDMTSTDAGGDAGPDLGVDMSVDAGLSTCEIGINTDNPPTDTCQHGGADWLAFRWTAPSNVAGVDSIELHTDEGEGALLSNDGGQPGTVLFQGMLSAADVDGWRTFEASMSIELTPGADYWIAENVLTCSVATDGPELEYRTADALAGPWSGPFTAHSWTAKVNGTCN